MGISPSYELEITQTQRRWKDCSKIFPTISRNTPNSSLSRSYGRLKFTKNSTLTQLIFSRIFLYFPKMTISSF
ncbi:hypothetical protein MTR67_047949 [Solanum verrucosum]|uniref:Uncharacterized protein n=1 Tax=Solanum verrucosum TaxID=315347 RepID=A0AAF0UZG1_SOLVR|nr:hypothetical protein MTR67_047949 [Solanum verrucosum]